MGGPTLTLTISVLHIPSICQYRRLLGYIPYHRHGALQSSFRLGQMGIEGLLD